MAARMAARKGMAILLARPALPAATIKPRPKDTTAMTDREILRRGTSMRAKRMRGAAVITASTKRRLSALFRTIGRSDS